MPKNKDPDLAIMRVMEVDSIVPDYFERERRENLIEQGFAVEMPERTYSDVERIIRKSDRDMEEVERKRTARLVFEDEWGNPIYDGGDADEIRGELIRRVVYL